MALFRATVFTDNTEQTVSATAAYVKSIRLYRPRDPATDAFLRLWDAVNPVPGADASDVTIPIVRAGVAPATSRTQPVVVVFPGSGLLFQTAVTAFVSQTPAGGAAPGNTSTPVVEINFAPIL